MCSLIPTPAKGAKGKVKFAMLIAASQLDYDLNAVPASAGVYFVYIREDASLLCSDAPAFWQSETPVRCDGHQLVYLGASGQSVRARVKCHLRGDSRVSSLRKTLGGLLLRELCLSPYRSSRTRFHFADGEERLTEWICRNTAYDFIENPDAFGLEKFLIQSLRPPFNITHRRHTPVAKDLMRANWILRGAPLRRSSGRSPQLSKLHCAS
jgi:hypothetical protein